MDVPLLRRFQVQVRDQCKVVLTAVEQINEGLTDEFYVDLVWIGCQNFVVGAGNMSKALWGIRGKGAEGRAKRRRPLRESLEVEDDSPLRDVDIRNHFEHYDERLERWWEESTAKLFADRNIGPVGMIGGLRNDLEVFRIFDPDTTNLTFWGERINLQEISAEAERILPIATREASKPSW